MGLYTYPPRIVNGSLYRTENIVEYTRGKILQVLSIVRGELVADPFFGVPIRVFSTITDVESDAARIESILQTEVPECDFIVISSLPNQGLVTLTVYWSYRGTENVEVFDLSVE